MTQSSEVIFLTGVERHINDILRVCHYAGTVAIVIMMIVTVANGIGRYALNAPITGTIEISSFLLLTASFLMIGYTLVLRRHIIIGIIVDRFSERTQAIIEAVTYTLGLMFCIVAVWQTVVLAMYQTEAGQTSGVLLVPLFPFYFIVAFGWAMLTVAALMRLIHIFYRVVKR